MSFDITARSPEQIQISEREFNGSDNPGAARPRQFFAVVVVSRAVAQRAQSRQR